ncbi:MAG: phage terminase large subunit, partial [Armatimonadota bacterium]
ETIHGGLAMARGVGSPPTGTGFGLILIDDPVRRREDADSEVYREKVWDWYTDDLYSRLEPDGVLGLTMTRWHEDDLGARAVASEPGQFEILRLPAIDERGQALWPERFPLAALERIQSVLRRKEGERSWEALYQQNPTPLEGAIFKVGRIGRLDACPPVKRSCLAWDFGYSTSGDFTVGLKLSELHDGRFVVERVARGQYSPEAKREAINQESRAAGCRVRLPQDPGAGKELVQQLVRMLAGCDVVSVPVSQAKEARAQGVAAQCEAGNLYIVNGAWNSDFIEELRAFPLGRHDDQVDALSDAFNEIVLAFDTKAATKRLGSFA